MSRYPRLLPWYVGATIIAVFELIVGYIFFTASPLCASPIPELFILLLLALPGVYLTLMYMTLKSQP